MLSATSRSPLPCGRLAITWLVAAGVLACAIPTLRSAPLLAPQEAAAAEAQGDESAKTPKRPTLLQQWESLSDEEADAITVRRLRALAVAVHLYADEHDGQLPPPAVPNAALPPEKRRRTCSASRAV